MEKFTFLTMLFISLWISASAQQNETVPFSGHAVPKERPAEYEFPSKAGANGIIKHVKQPSQNKSGIQLPYPIIFVHGLGMDSEDWNYITDSMDTFYGTTFGGRFDFCLNYDHNDATANTSFSPTANADIALFSGTWAVGDYYYVNFDVGDDGSCFDLTSGHDVKSRISAVVKQGKALSEVVYRVLQLTGRDKVILMAHSQGGMATRQYLQNPSIWQADNKHHIAKMVTAGSPHSGSNASLSEYLDWIIHVDLRSEAKRDVKHSYTVSGELGVFLYGGFESYSVIDDAQLSDYYNVDVNCNGHEGDYITGLNQKNIPRDLDFSCIIGDCDGCPQQVPGDGLVLATSANLNYIYPNLTKNVFWLYRSNLIQIHGDLPHLLYLDFQGMDEPNDYPLSYHVGFDTTYMAFTTPQPVGGYYNDYDDFKFSLSTNSYVKVSINNIYINDLKVRFVDSNGNHIGPGANSNGATSLNYTQAVSAGNYYLEIYGIPTTKSYLYPYKFKLTKTPNTSGIELSNNPDNIIIYPNPATSTLTIKGFTSKTSVRLYDMLGNLVMETETDGDKTLDVSQLPQGVYTFVGENKDDKIFHKVIISK